MSDILIKGHVAVIQQTYLGFPKFLMNFSRVFLIADLSDALSVAKVLSRRKGTSAPSFLPIFAQEKLAG